MSMTFPGLPPPPPPPEPVLATAVVLHRDGPRGREVFLVRRGRDLRFAGGWHAFPGGRLDPEDARVPVEGATGEDARLVACAARELFEETGVLAARGRERVPAAVREAARRALLDGALAFGDFLAANGLALQAAAFTPAGRWVTPEHLPLRYDARMFLLPLPPGEAPVVWPGELADGAMVPAADALGAWGRGQMLLHPPNLHALRMLDRPGTIDLSALRDPPHRDGPICRRIEFQQGFFLAALRTPTLPPATHTNAWLLPAEGGLAVVDPGAPEPAEQAALFALLDGLAAEGLPPREIWLTHAHPDHVGAVAALAARHGLPVRAHPLAADRAGAPVEPLREGERIGDGGRFRVLETPGHAREHLAFLDERSGALVCGDLVSTLSTIVIDPPEGDMAEYERQLARVEALGPRTIYPAHGPPAPDAVGKLAAYRAHRREREALVVAALAAGGTLAELTARAYADTPAALHPVAARSCLAVLEKLRGASRAEEAGGVWRAR
ncbi:MBL fold metallo-hydrolase [Anaeromyxobacter sp. Red801]|uniref:MBL fold metallo-hydrolase n=1 Tax=Anaeromyxobacter sp. Red801 TaxID=3411632 RepID=UPI003BA04055